MVRFGEVFVDGEVCFACRALCPPSLMLTLCLVYPTYWLFLKHLVLSSRYTTYLVVQLVCEGVLKDL